MIKKTILIVVGTAIVLSAIGCGSSSKDNAEAGAGGNVEKKDDGTVSKPTTNPETGDRM